MKSRLRDKILVFASGEILACGKGESSRYNESNIGAKNTVASEFSISERNKIECIMLFRRIFAAVTMF